MTRLVNGLFMMLVLLFVAFGTGVLVGNLFVFMFNASSVLLNLAAWPTLIVCLLILVRSSMVAGRTVSNYMFKEIE